MNVEKPLFMIHSSSWPAKICPQNGFVLVVIYPHDRPGEVVSRHGLSIL